VGAQAATQQQGKLVRELDLAAVCALDLGIFGIQAIGAIALLVADLGEQAAVQRVGERQFLARNGLVLHVDKTAGLELHAHVVERRVVLEVAGRAGLLGLTCEGGQSRAGHRSQHQRGPCQGQRQPAGGGAVAFSCLSRSLWNGIPAHTSHADGQAALALATRAK
jgi:hypothetical protein